MMESRYEITVKNGTKQRTLSSDGNRTLLELLRSAGCEIDAPCGGNGTCGQCRVRAGGAEVLACRTVPDRDMTVELPSAAEARVLTDGADIPPGGAGLGFAVDVGTTTVAAYLYDLETGKCRASRGAMNAQRTYGADVISRIRHAGTPEGLAALRDAIRAQLEELARSMCPETHLVRCVSIAGNTVMQHLFAGLDPTGIGAAPFTPLSLFGTEEEASAYFPGLFAPDCRLYLCPCVAGYVGGDITAGLLSSGAGRAEGKTLLIDIGTNGEMALGDRDGFLCCATAAGPAFEGAEIECGSPARDGAINAVEPDLSFSVLGDTAPRSICGSGLIDALAALLRSGIVDETGRMEAERFAFGGGDVYVSGQDVRKLQLAKAAIRAGIETLLEKSGTDCDGVDEVLIAGGFGAYLRVRSACAIGMLPPALMGKIRHVGNSAGKGAAMALAPEGRRALEGLRRLCRYEELSASPLFNDKYIEAMMFDEWEEVL